MLARFKRNGFGKAVCILAFNCIWYGHIAFIIVNSQNCRRICAVVRVLFAVFIILAVVTVAVNKIKVICAVFRYGKFKAYTVAVIFNSADHTLVITRCGIGAVISVSFSQKVSFFKFIAFNITVILISLSLFITFFNRDFVYICLVKVVHINQKLVLVKRLRVRLNLHA